MPQDDMINFKDLVYFKLLSESSHYVMYVVVGAGMFHVHAARGYVFKLLIDANCKSSSFNHNKPFSGGGMVPGGLVHISGTIEKRNKRRNKQSNHLCLNIYIYILCITVKLSHKIKHANVN